jgi:hypothetical protein
MFYIVTKIFSFVPLSLMTTLSYISAPGSGGDLVGLCI